MLQAMQPSDVAVMVREDRKVGLPRFAKLIKGMDFGRAFSTQYAAPLTGSTAPPGVLSNLARAAVAASYSDSTTAEAAAAAASRNTFAAWAERVQQNPQQAAQRDQCQGGGLHEHAGDAATAAAAGMSEEQLVLVQQSLPDSQLSALLSLADLVNATLEEWQAAATTELFWLLGMNPLSLNPANFTVVEDSKDGVVAFAQLQQQSAAAGKPYEFRSLVVAPQHRGQGIGRGLLHKMLAERPDDDIYLTTLSRHTLFYEQEGFRLLRLSEVPQ
eukprot:gene9068-9238_t